MTSAGHRLFYQFLGAHSLLIGLFPFFIPVWLYKEGHSLANLCLFIAISGASFCVSLRAWELICRRYTLSRLFSITFVLELALVGVAHLFSESALFLAGFALINGAYNCFFWTTQRTLFLELVQQQTSGKQYGNFQIFVMIFLKIGIFCGGLLLEHVGLVGVFVASSITTLGMTLYFHRKTIIRQPDGKPADGGILSRKILKANYQVVTIRQLLNFTDDFRSRPVFLIDGLFLFLESHLWTLSLFFLSKQNFANLGFIVIILAIVFSLMFFFTKNTIDKLAGRHIFVWAVLVYAAGWLLRTVVNSDTANQWLLIVLLIVTFCTSFFRLAFNKQFFDIAKFHANLSESGVRYLVFKSYLTQASVTVLFGLLALLALTIDNVETALNLFYALAGCAALTYLLYRPCPRNTTL